MVKGNNYEYLKIVNFADKNNYNVEELGNNGIGQNFILLQHEEKDIILSFVLTGVGNNQYIYECVYSDL